ncbi:enoyl-CoA hydratase/isomerase family protein [Rhizobium sp. CG5]|uniref:enoyl-CoA hydratase/isomerase family protein n=1 Tax=Rhizobium sp. CG5 TaxID=2726076 RepID=UPI0020349948|nr:enoyl-CoA hydratase/isomerase family protein [Rhizobium sp. CG5]MCM2477251.1 enoyl-CoA hydratase/isomerase family protein [Rhizobium sp. CG5]
MVALSVTEGDTPRSVSVVERDGRHHLIIDRAAKGNALSSEIVADLCAGFDRCLDEGARVIVLEGQGKHFCTGFDLSTLESETDASLLLRFVEIEKLLQKVHSSPVMTVAIGKGRCFGAGADLFVSCDRRIALEGASFSFPGAAFGLVLGTSRLAGRIGRDNARTCLTGGLTLTDQAALAQGLATDIVAADGLEELLSGIGIAGHRLEAETVKALYVATDAADYDADLASLVRSASRVGIRERIRIYRDKVKAA